MPRLAEILAKAYKYTKSHKFLWLFGFFLTGAGSLNFLRYVDADPDKLIHGAHEFFMSFKENPGYFFLVSLVSIFLFIALLALSSISRSAIIYSGLHLERKEHITLKGVLNAVQPFFRRVLFLSLATYLGMLFLLFWFMVPAYFIIYHGYYFRGSLILFVGFVILLPLVIYLSMINIFGACFVVVYNLSFPRALQSAFDLFTRYWERVVGLLFVLFLVYLFLFLFSASVLGLIGLLAYALFNLLKSLSTPLLFGAVSIIFALLSITLVTINAALNVFTNLCWTLFFLKLVKAKRFGELEKAVAPETAI